MCIQLSSLSFRRPQAGNKAGPKPANGRDRREDCPGDASIADAIDAMDPAPPDGGPHVVVQQVGPVNGTEAGDDPLKIPEILRRVH